MHNLVSYLLLLLNLFFSSYGDNDFLGCGGFIQVEGVGLDLSQVEIRLYLIIFMHLSKEN